MTERVEQSGEAARRAHMASEDAAEAEVPDDEERSPDQATVSSSEDPTAARIQKPGNR